MDNVGMRALSKLIFTSFLSLEVNVGIVDGGKDR